jgi:LPXTG-site transpeptidase (sortase) family protein
MSLLDDPPAADAAGPGPDDGQPAAGADSDRRARSAVIAVVLALLALWAVDVYLVPAAGRVRQDHRAAEYQEPARRVGVGDPALLLQVPALQLDQVVVKGATPALLQGGPGWREGSAPPGTGNTVVLGRSTRWTYPFAQLSKVPKGATIYLRTRDGRVYKYQVKSVKRLRSGLTSVMDPTGRNRLTLVTSAGGPLDTSRTVVVATGVGTPVPTPKAFSEPVRKLTDLGPFDERGPGGLLLLLAGFVVVGLGVVGVLEMRGRYSTFTVCVVAGPALALGVVLVLFHLDAFLPITY